MLDRAILRQRIRRVLRQHEGHDRCIGMVELTARIMNDLILPARRYDQSRIVRSIVRELRRDGWPVCVRGGAGGGYFLAATAAELDATVTVFHGRALSSLSVERDLRQISIHDLVRQVELDLTQSE